jgi:RNA polymerase sigma-70 factor (ECF subfamily)
MPRCVPEATAEEQQVSDRADDSLVAQWRAGDQQAADALFRRYADRLIALARSRLSTKVGQRVDPEDVVHSAYRSFFADARAGRYEPQRGGDLWRLLVGITLHKVSHQVRRNLTAKRSVNRECSFASEDSMLGQNIPLLANDPSPLDAVMLTDEIERLMRRLEPPERRMLELRLQGYNLEEIAARIPCSERTVRYAMKEVQQHLQHRQREDSSS